jgi:transketolase
VTAIETKNPREAYGATLVELGRRDPRVVALEADLGNSTRSVLFAKEFPARFFQMGIAEQNMASTAAGLALAGKLPYVHSFAVFATGRAFDQVRCSICIPALPVRICGSSAGLSDFGDGKTHQSVEDLATMRSLPHMTVLSPADALETALMTEATAGIAGPVYLRINRNDLPAVTPRGEPWVLGKIWELRKGRDVAIFATGALVSRALDAAERLARDGIEAKVLNVSTIKPLDRDAVIAHARAVKGIVTAEEGTILGGLGSAVLEALRRERHGPVEMVGIADRFGTSARSYDELLRAYGLTSEAIADAVRSVLS